MDYTMVLSEYSVSFKNDFTEAVVNFLGYLEHVEKTHIDKVDAQHLMRYYRYLLNNLIEETEDWVRRVLFTPLDMFLNFLYSSGYSISSESRDV